MERTFSGSQSWSNASGGGPEAENASAVMDKTPQLLLLRSERVIPGALTDDQGGDLDGPGRKTGNAFEPDARFLKRRSRFAGRIV